MKMKEEVVDYYLKFVLFNYDPWVGIHVISWHEMLCLNILFHSYLAGLQWWKHTKKCGVLNKMLIALLFFSKVVRWIYFTNVFYEYCFSFNSFFLIGEINIFNKDLITNLMTFKMLFCNYPNNNVWWGRIKRP